MLNRKPKQSSNLRAKFESKFMSEKTLMHEEIVEGEASVDSVGNI